MQITCGDWTLDTDRKALTRNGAPVHVEPKALQLLEFLITERPRVVTKPELLARIWADTAVTEASLTRLIKQLRDALGDDPDEPRYIQTARRFGYGFLGVPTSPPRHERATCRLIGRTGVVWLDAGETVIGRTTHALPVLDDPSISRRHARLGIDRLGAWIEDLQSKNGTFVGAVRVADRHPLRDGDVVRLGVVPFVMRVSSVSASTLLVETT